MTPLCARVEAVVDEVVAGGAWPDDLAPHVEGCATCRARVDLARRIDRTLAAWPTLPPPPDFAARVAAAARREAWTQEVVVDWGFNLAVAGSLALILVGVVATLWMASTSAPTGDAARVAATMVADVAARARAQAPVALTAVAMLVVAVGGWWWAEQRDW